MEPLSASPEATRVAQIPPGGYSHILFTSAFWAARAGGVLLLSSQDLYISPCGNAEARDPAPAHRHPSPPLALQAALGSLFAHLCKGSSTSWSTLTRAGDKCGARAGSHGWSGRGSLECPHCSSSAAASQFNLSRRPLSTAGTAITHLVQAAALMRVGQSPHTAHGTQASSPECPTEGQSLALFTGHIMALTILQEIFPR